MAAAAVLLASRAPQSGWTDRYVERRNTMAIQHKTTSSHNDVGPRNELQRGASDVTGFAGRAVFATRWGGPDVLRVAARRIGPPASDQIVVEVAAAGVAFGDILLREGLRREPRPPVIPGYDAAGVVRAVGSDVHDVREGDSVAVWTGGSGGYATHVVVPRTAAVRYPPELAAASVTSLVLNYVTAWQMLTRSVALADGATILVHSAAGGVGSALLELGALRGMTMFGTASAAKANFVAQLGGIPIDYRSEDYAKRVRAQAPDGIDAVFDALGPASWKSALPLLRPGGHLVVYGLSSAFKNGRRDIPGLLSGLLRAPRTSYLTYFLKGVGVSGYNSGEVIPARPDWFTQDLSYLIGLLADGKIAPRIHRTFALEDAAEAHKELGAGRATGKIVLIP